MRILRDLQRELGRGSERSAVAYHAVHQSQAKRFGRVDRTAGEQHLVHRLASHQAQQRWNHRGGGDADTHFRIADGGALFRDRQVRPADEVGAQAQRRPVDGGDGHFRIVPDQPVQRQDMLVLAAVFQRRRLAHFAQIGAAGERGARASENDDDYLIVRRDIFQGCRHLLDERRAKRIALFGFVQRNDGDGGFFLHQQAGIGHYFVPRVVDSFGATATGISPERCRLHARPCPTLPSPP